MDSDLSAMINKIISDPSFAEMVGRVRGNDSSKSAEEISSDMASKLPDVMAMLAPMLSSDTGSQNSGKQDESSENSDHSAKSEDAAPNIGTQNGIIQKKYDKVHAEKLLAAIKPYLSSSRCEIIDKCVSVMQITDVVNAFGGLESLLKKQ